MTALHFAAFHNEGSIVKFLCEQGCNINTTNNVRRVDGIFVVYFMFVKSLFVCLFCFLSFANLFFGVCLR